MTFESGNQRHIPYIATKRQGDNLISVCFFLCVCVRVEACVHSNALTTGLTYAINPDKDPSSLSMA